MLFHLSLIVLSLVLLYAGAEGLVRGGSALGLRFGLSPLVIGLTIVAMGTSSPELVVSLKAALDGQGDVALGNVVGSNIFNIGIILGFTALICPIRVQLQLIKWDAPLMIFTALLLPLLFWDSLLNRGESSLLVAGILAYTALNIYWARIDKSTPETSEEFEQAIPQKSKHWSVEVLFILAGLAILIVGARLLVDNAIAMATRFQISDAIIGLTIVAAGTSLPELATSIVAALRKQPDIAVGNVIGSNIFNTLAILGAAGLASPLHAPNINLSDILVMIAFSILLLPLLWSGFTLRRIEGAILLIAYFAYMYSLWPK